VAERGGASGGFSTFTALQNEIAKPQVDRAAVLAAELVADVVRTVTEQPDLIVADVVCQRLGTVLHEAASAPVGQRVGQHHLAEALPIAAGDAVMAALTDTTGPDDTWNAPWEVLTALRWVLPYPFSDIADEAMAGLPATKAGRMLPAPPPGPAVTGPVLMARDLYGSRFAVAAPISAEPDQQARWYLWDIDACGHEAFTVHSGFHPTAEAAFTEWRSGVGETATAGAGLTPVQDAELVASLLPAELGLLRPGGETRTQFTEYHRSKRLAELASQALPRQSSPATGLTAAEAAKEFSAWLHDRDPSALPDNLDELVTELADSWNLSGIAATFTTCSPHRVALCVPHLREFYQDEFADQVVALLPDWIRWLATSSDLQPELVDRCLPYAHGQPHPAHTDNKTHYLARVTE
jgi:hypothetical protein